MEFNLNEDIRSNKTEESNSPLFNNNSNLNETESQSYQPSFAFLNETRDHTYGKKRKNSYKFASHKEFSRKKVNYYFKQ